MRNDINNEFQARKTTQNPPNIHSNFVTVELAWQALSQGSDKQALVSFQESIRELTGVAAAAGYPKVADLGEIIDLMLSPVVAGEEAFTSELHFIIRDYLLAARELSLHGPQHSPQTTSLKSATADQQPVVLLLEPDQQLAKKLSSQLEPFGYIVRLVQDYRELLSAVVAGKPHAIIIDDVYVGSGEITSEHTDQLRLHIGERLPLIFLGRYDDVESRLAAARAGADIYLLKPIDLHELVDQLDRIDSDDEPEPFHIIIVEDSPTQAAYYSAILEKAGMVTTTVSDPRRVLDILSENTIDLVLMDMYMPDCNGMELAKVIRQVPQHASIPIVYLSSELELERQLDALSLGGDDFLTKPVNPMYMIRSIAIRAERARSLRTLMVTDNLTGLLNHSRIKEQLQTEVARAQRSGYLLSFAMLDIDHFKRINDTYGHHVGDRVIKTLARVLQQRLRQTDYIGRYGGEEFAVILPGASIDKAVMILDELRIEFSKIYQLSPSGAFNVTFSGGVASLVDIDDASTLAVAADKALYVAKNKGRNRIEPYLPEIDA